MPTPNRINLLHAAMQAGNDTTEADYTIVLGAILVMDMPDATRSTLLASLQRIYRLATGHLQQERGNDASTDSRV